MRLITKSFWGATGVMCALLLFVSAPVLAFYGDCGNVNDSGGIDIDDIVYLIAYVFQGGPEPDCGGGSIGTVTDFDGNL